MKRGEGINKGQVKAEEERRRGRREEKWGKKEKLMGLARGGEGKRIKEMDNNKK